jgi:hypothetical protein
VVHHGYESQRRTQFELTGCPPGGGGKSRDEQLLGQAQPFSPPAELVKVDKTPEAESNHASCDGQNDAHRSAVAGVIAPIGKSGEDSELHEAPEANIGPNQRGSCSVVHRDEGTRRQTRS